MIISQVRRGREGGREKRWSDCRVESDVWKGRRERGRGNGKQLWVVKFW